MLKTYLYNDPVPDFCTPLSSKTPTRLQPVWSLKVGRYISEFQHSLQGIYTRTARVKTSHCLCAYVDGGYCLYGDVIPEEVDAANYTQQLRELQSYVMAPPPPSPNKLPLANVMSLPQDTALHVSSSVSLDLHECRSSSTTSQ